MLKKFLFVTVLLLLVSVQALAASCDVRCSLMGTSPNRHAWHADERMAHCSGMSMDKDKQASLTASDCCAPTGCVTQLKAMVKGAEQNDAASSRLLVSLVALLVDPFENSGSIRPSDFASLSRTNDSRPLAQRPGSSLRI